MRESLVNIRMIIVVFVKRSHNSRFTNDWIRPPSPEIGVVHVLAEGALAMEYGRISDLNPAGLLSFVLFLVFSETHLTRPEPWPPSSLATSIRTMLDQKTKRDTDGKFRRG